MKKSILYASISGMFAALPATSFANLIVGAGGTGLTTSNATVFEVNEKLIGHNLIVPYYTVQDGRTTAINITNTDAVRGKVVKVRFRGAGNSDDVLDFQVYLSPKDMFGFGLRESSLGGLEAFTVDNSCTIPRFDAVPGSNNADKRNFAQGFARGGALRLPASVGLSGTREGYVEIFTMADITGNGTANLSREVWHTDGVARCSASIFSNTSSLLLDDSLLSTPNVANVRSFGLDTPSTGLTADWYILNSVQNTSFSGAAIAIEARTATGAAGVGNFVLFPQMQTLYGSLTDDVTSDPILTSNSNNLFAVKNPDGVSGVAYSTQFTGAVFPLVSPVMFDFPDMSTPYLVTTDATGAIVPVAPSAQVQALSRSLEAQDIINEFVTQDTFETDWVFSLPIRRYSVAVHYGNSSVLPITPASLVFHRGISGANTGAGDGIAFFHSSNTVLKVGPGGVDDPRACVEKYPLISVGREEEDGLVPRVSPGDSEALSFCGEVAVLSFNGSNVLDGVLSRQEVSINPSAIKDGWAEIIATKSYNYTFTPAGGTPTTTTGSAGLPIAGYAAIKAVNGSTSPVRNFGYTWPHKYR